jgi:hypothetical protein
VNRRAALALPIAVLCAVSAGCGDPNAFDENVAKIVAEGEPFQLDSEQVSMRDNQLACAANEDLWEQPSANGEHSIAHLQQKGRKLNFSDDVTAGDSAYMSPYTQVRGKFPLQLDKVVSTRDGDDKDTKIVQAKIGIKVAHPCFDGPLAIMGVRKGRYSDDLPVTLQYEREGNGWRLTKIIH